MKELFKVKFNGHTYAGYGYIKSTKNATTEIVEVDEDGADTISVGKDKWYNRPWYRFQFGNALEDAVIKWFGKQASEKIHRAVNDSRDCQEAMDKFISSLNVRESYKRRINESLSGRDRVKFITKMVDKLTKEPFLYSHEEANDIAIKHADNVSKNWGGWEDMDAYIRADLRRILPKKDYDATYGEKNESYKRRIREARERHIKDLTDEELVALRKEIRLGSLFYRDYNNSFGIDEHEVCDFFDGFLDDAEDNFKYEFGRYPEDAGELYDYCDNDDALLTYANYMIEW